MPDQTWSCDDPVDAMTIDALHQFAYCPRRAHLMHAEGLMAHNVFTEDGKRVHRRIDRVDHALDGPRRLRRWAQRLPAAGRRAQGLH